MMTEYIRYQLTAHAPEALIDAYARAGQHLQAAPECLSYELSQCEKEPNAFVLRILWTSTQAHMEGFRRGPTSRPSSP